jgi:hypothetical protein
MFFEMFQPRIDDLLHAIHFGPEQFLDIVNVPVCIVQALIIDQYANQHCNRGESGCGKRRHQTIGNNHLPDPTRQQSNSKNIAFPEVACLA